MLCTLCSCPYPQRPCHKQVVGERSGGVGKAQAFYPLCCLPLTADLNDLFPLLGLPDGVAVT